MTDVRSWFGDNRGEESLPAEVLGVVQTSLYGATWVMAFPSNVDVIYSLVQVGAGKDVFSRRDVFDVWANHCRP